MYKDKEKQREANRQAQAKRRQGMTLEGMTKQIDVIPEQPKSVIPSTKRGGDIKCFEDLPADVQLDIVKMSASKAGNDEEAYQLERQNRTERAIRYQRLFPDRFYPGGREVVGPVPILRG